MKEYLKTRLKKTTNYGCVILISWLPLTAAVAKTIVVNSTVDVSVGSSPVRCILATDQCTLRAAIVLANQISGKDVISLSAHQYELNSFVSVAGQRNDELEIIGTGRSATTIKGVSADHVFDISGKLSISNVIDIRLKIL